MAISLKKNYTIDLKAYNKYIQDFEEKLIEIYDTMNTIYNALDGCIMNKQYWCDDNALEFVKWFRSNQPDSYVLGYSSILTIFGQTGCKICTEIMKSQPTSYSKYSYIKKYAGKGSIWDSLSIVYKNTKVSKIFTNINLTDTIKADKMVVEIMYKSVTQNTNKLSVLGNELAALVRAFGVGKKGISIEGLDCQASARLICRIDLFTKPLLKKLQECITKTDGLGGIINVVK